MSRFSVATAFSSGVGLIERIPWTIVIWGVATLVLQLLPRLVIWGINGHGDISTFHAGQDMTPPPAMVPTPGTPDNGAAAIQALMARIALTWQLSSLLWLWGVLSAAIMYSAIYRAMLEPANRGFAYLRLGMAELWQAVMMIAYGVLIGVIAFVGVLVVIAVGLAAHSLPAPWGPVAAMVGIVLVVLTAVAMAVRFSLAGPMTFATRAFRLFESWGLTKNNGWGVFWTKFLAYALIVGVEIVLLIAIVYPLLIVSVLFGAVNAKAAAADPLGTPVTMALAALIMLAAAICGAALRTVVIAPNAAVYAALKE